MYNYRIYCMEIESDIEFPQLVISERHAVADAVICKGDVRRREDAPGNINYEIGVSFSWLENKTCCMSIENGSRITYKLKENGNRSYLLTYILGWGMAILAYQRNELAMHCSAVCDDEGAVLICGESGSGKSTLTTGFLESGYRFLADDMAYVQAERDAVYVKPAFPYRKLCRDAVLASGCAGKDMIYIDETKDKFLVPYMGEFSSERVKIKRIIILYKCRGEDIVCSEITGIDKMHICLNNLFLRKLLKERIYEPASGRQALQVASLIPMYAMGRPEGKDTYNEMIGKALSNILFC